jgi:hypothetical protein
MFCSRWSTKFRPRETHRQLRRSPVFGFEFVCIALVPDSGASLRGGRTARRRAQAPAPARTPGMTAKCMSVCTNAGEDGAGEEGERTMYVRRPSAATCGERIGGHAARRLPRGASSRSRAPSAVPPAAPSGRCSRARISSPRPQSEDSFRRVRGRRGLVRRGRMRAEAGGRVGGDDQVPGR